MTKDYEADSIADETRRDVERQMQSPYTRDEFIAAESDRWRKLNPHQSDDVDTPTEAVMAAAAAERAGITWRNEAPATAPEPAATAVRRFEDRVAAAEESIEQCHDRVHRHDVRLTVLEQQVAQPIVAEIRDPTGARTIYHATEERTKQEIRVLIREEIGSLIEEVIHPIDETVAEHDRRLSLQLERITELTNRKDEALGRIARLEIGKSSMDGRVDEMDRRINRIESEWKIEGQKLATDRAKLRSFVIDGVGRGLESLRGQVETMWTRLFHSVDDQANSSGLLAVVRRLDADMALVRDAVCPPQGAAVGGIDADRASELLRKLGRADALFDINGTRVWGERNVDDIRDLLHVYGHKPVAYGEDVTPAEPTQVSVNDSGYRERVEVAHLDDIVASALHEQYEWVDTLNGLRYLAGAAGVQVDDNRKGWTPSLHPEPVMRLELVRLGVLVDKYAEHLRDTRDALRQACLELGADAAWSDDTNLADVVSKILLPHILHQLSSGHDDLAFALGRAYVALKDLEPYEPKIADEEMEAIRQVLGNNYRDWLRPREAG